MAIIYGIPDSQRLLLKFPHKSSRLSAGVKDELVVLDKLAELDDNY